VYGQFRRTKGQTGAARASLVGRVAGAALAVTVLAQAVGAESLVGTQLRRNAIGWFRGEAYRRDLRKTLALRQLREALRKASKASGPSAAVYGIRLGGEISGVAGLGREVVPDLVAMLTDADPDTRAVAVFTLARIAPEAAEGMVALTDALRDNPHADVRLGTVKALGWMVPRARQAVPAVVRTLEKVEANGVRQYAAWALGMTLRWPENPHDVEVLGETGPEVKVAVTALTNALRDEGGGVPAKATEALAVIGPPAKSAVPALLALLKDDKVNRDLVGWALRRIDPEGARQAGFLPR
jgi:hypothetical protein